MRERVLKIDATTSNFYGNPKHPNLRQVASRTVTVSGVERQATDLAPNTLELLLL